MQLLVLALDAALYPTLLAAVVILLAQPRRVPLLTAYLAGGLTISIGLGLAIIAALKDSAAAHHPTGADIALVVGFNLIMFMLAEIPLLGLLLAPERTGEIVTRLNDWISGHGRQIATGLCTVLGAFLIVRGISLS